MWARGAIALRTALWQVYIGLLGDLRPFLRQMRSSDSVYIARDIFLFEPYLQQVSPARQGFVKELVQTQNFMNFVEKAYRAEQEGGEVLAFMRKMESVQTKGEYDTKANVEKTCEQLLHCIPNVRKSNP